MLKAHHGDGHRRTQLMDWALDEARAPRRRASFTSRVFIDNHRARRFYERYGFEQVGRYDFMVGNHADEDIIMRKVAVSGVEVIRAVSLGGLPHGFLGRRGGVSTGELAGLNVGYGSNDDRAAIDENRRRAIAAVLPGAELATVHQVHSADARSRSSSAWPQDERPQRRRDGHRPARTCCSASSPPIARRCCSPMPMPGVVGAAHAGWRGALAGVTDSTIAAMEQLGARRDHIHAAVGPCIAQPSYEVDDGFRARFLDADAGNERFFVDGPGRQAAFRPRSLCRPPADRRRASARSRRSTSTPMPTPTASTAIRRATHRGEADYGRQVSAYRLPR